MISASIDITTTMAAPTTVSHTAFRLLPKSRMAFLTDT